MQLGLGCTTRVNPSLDQTQTPHAAAVVGVQKVEGYIASDRQPHALLHAWQDMVQNGSMVHLDYHLYITDIVTRWQTNVLQTVYYTAH